MKKIVLFLILSFSMIAAGLLLGNLHAAGAMPRACATFTLDNATTDSLGTVTISGGGSYADFNVTGYGQYQQQLCFTPETATVEGTTVAYPNSALDTLTGGAVVEVGWQSPGLVEVADPIPQDRPVE